METMRQPNHLFIASPYENTTHTYRSVWIRDTLYANFSYWYLGEYQKLKEGVWTVFDLFKKYEEKLSIRILSPTDIPEGTLHAKFHPTTCEEITTDDGWGHHQLDALGLFLHIIADLDFKNIRTIRDENDTRILEMLTAYLRSVEYWQRPDFGMWEECKIRHASSMGAVISGLTKIRNRRLVKVPESLIIAGEKAFHEILPFESRDYCGIPHHRHDCDASLLSLLWPYNIIPNPQKADEILARVIGEHYAEHGERHALAQTHGLNRYYGDDYYRSTEGTYRGISAEWPLFKFWISIIYSQKNDYPNAWRWFEDGCWEISHDMIPEAYQNGKPNHHTPLAWAHAIALIAWAKLPDEYKKKCS